MKTLAFDGWLLSDGEAALGMAFTRGTDNGALAGSIEPGAASAHERPRRRGRKLALEVYGGNARGRAVRLAAGLDCWFQTFRPD